jgi:hypothetical protein
MLLELLKLTQETRAGARKLPCPAYMFTAGHETIVNNQVNDALFDRLVGAKTKHNFPEAWHDLMFDPVLDELVDILVNWMTEVSKERLSIS